MPLTLNQLKAKMRQNPEKFREDQQKLMDFSKTLYKGALQNERIAARPLFRSAESTGWIGYCRNSY